MEGACTTGTALSPVDWCFWSLGKAFFNSGSLGTAVRLSVECCERIERLLLPLDSLDLLTTLKTTQLTEEPR